MQWVNANAQASQKITTNQCTSSSQHIKAQIHHNKSMHKKLNMPTIQINQAEMVGHSVHYIFKVARA
jgi:hypothetical protein